MLGTLGQRLHVELRQVPAVLVPAQVPLPEWNGRLSRLTSLDVLSLQAVRRCYLSEPHAVPLVGRLLHLGCVHQLEAGLVLLVEVRVLATASKLGRVLVCARKTFGGQTVIVSDSRKTFAQKVSHPFSVLMVLFGHI